MKIGLRFSVASALMALACGSSGTAPSSTTPLSATTVAIANDAASPTKIVVPRGTQVTFINNDNRPHDMQSDPHPEHTDCPEIGQVGFLNPGQTRQTGNLNIARTCGYHDHDAPDVKSLQGSIIIQ